MTGTPWHLLNDIFTVAVVCTQWGDTGKGRIVDVLGEWADIIGRGTGGDNAGHTIKIGEKIYVFHVIPSGIIRDGEGKTNVIGSGVAFNPRVCIEELSILKQERMSFDRLAIAHNARLILPQHILMDRLRESLADGGHIGTTGRGIGPTYVDHYARVGLTVNDMLNPDSFRRKLERNLAEKRKLLSHYDPELIRSLMRHEHLGSGAFYSAKRFFDVDAIIAQYRNYGIVLRSLIRDTDQLMNDALGKLRILLEGAQGNLLSVDYGTYPYITSSECSVQGLARGMGILERRVDLTLGIVKAFYMSRVGEGPFPTELGGQESARWCNDPATTELVEIERYPNASVNSENPFIQGIGIRRAGNEYGSTTKRPRRTGWLDLPLLRYSKRLTGPHTILTKLDVLNRCETIKICHAYRYEGPPYILGERTFMHGDVIQTATPNFDVLQHCVPLYREFKGWHQDISGIRTADELPPQLRQCIEYVAKEARLTIAALSVGAEREQMIVLKK